MFGFNRLNFRFSFWKEALKLLCSFFVICPFCVEVSRRWGKVDSSDMVSVNLLLVEFSGSGEVQRYAHARRCNQEKYEVVAPCSAV